MYGIIGAAVVTAAMSLLVIKRLRLRSPDGQPLVLEPKTVGSGVRYLAGGSIFGLGWALTGACPGPLVALGRGGRAGHAGNDSERARRHVDLRTAAPEAAALKG